MNRKKLFEIISSFKDKKILVIGDVMLDQFIYGDVSRISPEAPIPVMKKTSELLAPGGAGNVANNLTALGSHVFLSAVVGNDSSKKTLFKVLKSQGINTSGILVNPKRSTTLKQRIIARNQQMVRVDDEISDNLSPKLEKRLLTLIKPLIQKSDYIILSDYAKGIFSKTLVKEIISLARKNKKKIIADIKPQNKDLFVGVDLIAPNLKEAQQMAEETDVDKAGKKLVKYFNCDVIITKSEEGISIYFNNKKKKDLPTEKIKVIDVSGAGDTVMAVLGLSLASGATLEESAFLANLAGKIVVQKLGTASLNKEELTSALQKDNHLEGVDMVPKLWGYEKWLENNDKYCCKLLSIKKGYQCSLHYHKIKDEMFFITQGHIRVELDKKILHLRPGNFIRVKPGQKHRFRGIEDSLFIEISTHHDESDSYRVEESRKVVGDLFSHD